MFSPPYSNKVGGSWNDKEILKSVYVNEVEELVRKVTGARKVFTDQVVVRNQIWEEVDGLARSQEKETQTQTPLPDQVQDGQENEKEKEKKELETTHEFEFPKLIGVTHGTGASPAPKVHLDFAPEGARTHLRKYHPQTTFLAKEIIDAEERCMREHGIGIQELGKGGKYEGPRWAMFSIWRPLKRVKRDPLAVGDCSGAEAGDGISQKSTLLPVVDKTEGFREEERGELDGPEKPA
ncbi:hypothetical protein EG329_010094 [Mollisiaceae sp. DMI_Dod_QoI]|nr:hypothetical protein EG329_010094 [Helotiales sp. DMI_Dod_QoI]